MDAARSLLADHPEREPSTREIYEMSGVAAPTLYHHFKDKDGLLEVVVEEVFAAYLERKRAVPVTGDLLVDFAAGWEMHVGFGLENPVLYAFMFGPQKGQLSPTAQHAEAELRSGLERLAKAGILQLGLDEAAELTMAMAIGCVTQLIRNGGSATGRMAQSMLAALISQLTGQAAKRDAADSAARTLLARLDAISGPFTPAETAMLGQWLRALVSHLEASPATSIEGSGESRKNP